MMVVSMDRLIFIVELAMRVVSVPVLPTLPVVIMGRYFSVVVRMSSIPMVIAMMIVSMTMNICVVSVMVIVSMVHIIVVIVDVFVVHIVLIIVMVAMVVICSVRSMRSIKVMLHLHIFVSSMELRVVSVFMVLKL